MIEAKSEPRPDLEALRGSLKAAQGQIADLTSALAGANKTVISHATNLQKLRADLKHSLEQQTPLREKVTALKTEADQMKSAMETAAHGFSNRLAKEIRERRRNAERAWKYEDAATRTLKSERRDEAFEDLRAEIKIAQAQLRTTRHDLEISIAHRQTDLQKYKRMEIELLTTMEKQNQAIIVQHQREQLRKAAKKVPAPHVERIPAAVKVGPPTVNEAPPRMVPIPNLAAVPVGESDEPAPGEKE